MPQETKLLDLLVQWEERRHEGRAPTVEELCPDDVRLQDALRRRIEKRQRMQALLELPTETQFCPAPPQPGPAPVIPGFEILEVLGRGGMGVVYKARQHGLNRTVALKMILAGGGAGPLERERFRAEAEAVARLQHPGIVQIHAVGEHGGCPFLVLELVEGGSLAQHLDGKPLPARRAAELVRALAEAVEHAHRQGIIHRDLKPANVLLGGASGGRESAGSENSASSTGGLTSAAR